MPDVQMPDGTLVAFPDTMSKEQIRSIIASKFPEVAGPVGNDAGARNAFAYGVSGGAVPFGNRATSALAAVGAKGSDLFRKNNLFEGQSVGDLYNQSLLDTKATQEANPGATLAGNLTGIATALPLASSKAIFGATPTQGIRGAVNEIPKGLAAIGNFARSGKAAQDASALAKLGSLGLRSVKGAAVAAPVGALYGAGEADPGEMLEGARSGAGMAAGVGAALPVAGAAGLSALGTVVPKIDDATAALASQAQKFGIPLRLDQLSPTRVRNTVQKVSQEIPLSGVDTFEKKQRQAFTRAVAKTIGQDADDLGPSVIQGFRQDISRKFDKAIGNQTIQVAPDAATAIQNIVDEATGTIDGALVKVVRKNADDLLEQLQAGQISGEKLSSIRSQLLKRSTKAKSEAGQFINDLIDVIDTTIDQNLPPEKIAELAEARLQWRNFKTIQPLLEKSTEGIINPTELLNRVSSNKFIDASKVAVGEDDLIDLARIGKQFMAKKGGSDTFQKGALGLGLSTGVGALTNLPATLTAMGAAGGVMTANRGLQAINTSQRLAGKVINRKKSALKRLAAPETVASGASGGVVLQQ